LWLINEINTVAFGVKTFAVLTYGLDLRSYSRGVNASPYETHANGAPLLEMKASGQKVAVNQFKA
jgi:hypothetical protein